MIGQLEIRPCGGLNKQSIEHAVDTFSMSNIKAFSKVDLDRLLTTMESAAAGDPGPLLRDMLRQAISEGHVFLP